MEISITKPWYKKWWGIFLIVLLYPVLGPYLIWTKSNWNIHIKIASIFAILLIFFISTQDKNNTELVIMTQPAPIKETNAIIDDKEVATELNPFYQIDETINKLSSVGVGKLDNWSDDQMGGYMSLTPYFTFGSPSKNIPMMANNLAIYLTSENKAYIEDLEIVLNINNPSEQAIALDKLKETTGKVFNVLGIELSDELSNSIINAKEFSSESGIYLVSLVLQKSNINTWKVVVKSK